jgi:hypothetical protein
MITEKRAEVQKGDLVKEHALLVKVFQRTQVVKETQRHVYRTRGVLNAERNVKRNMN